MSTPLMDQYTSIKSRFQDFLVLFRLGDFYELFNQDAVIASNLLGIVLTKRSEVPMSGIPAHSLEIHIRQLIKHHKLAICEQIETVEDAKSQKRNLVQRDVTRIITKGSYVDTSIDCYNFILAIKKIETGFNLCYCDLGTGDCFLEIVENQYLLSAIYKIKPSEILIEEHLPELNLFEEQIMICNYTAINLLLPLELTENELWLISQIKGYSIYCGLNFEPNILRVNSKLQLQLSETTIKNLELLQDATGSGENSLLTFLNKTNTSCGYRILKNFLLNPLNSISAINERLDCIDFFIILRSLLA